MESPTTSTSGTVTVGHYLTERLHQLGVTDVFGVPGDYNLALLDQILADTRMSFVGCCNELDAGYAADGYARARGVGAVVTTFSVGALSALNAIAGAHAEGLPVILISGGPNTRSRHEHEVLHHTIDTRDYGYQRSIFEHVTASAVTIDHLEDAAAGIDRALLAALEQRRPAYIEIAANLAGMAIPAPEPLRFAPRTGDPAAVDAAVASLLDRLDGSQKPVVLVGAQARRWASTGAVVALADALGCAVASMPDAKGLFPEDHPGHVGTYWGPISDPGVAALVESADLVLAVGPVFTDYTTAGHSCLLRPDTLAVVGPDRVESAGRTFSAVPMEEVLDGLTKLATPKPQSLRIRSAHRPPEHRAGTGAPTEASATLTAALLAGRVEAMLDGTTTLVAETGDSWFHAIGMHLPAGADFQIQMKYGSIGWSVGAALGLAMADRDRKVVAMIGDGSFQMTAQELSTMLRHEVPVTIFVINNGGYTIEVEIHDGPYNEIQGWRYASLVEAFGDSGRGRGVTVTTVGELDDAIAAAGASRGVDLIEVVLDRDDCSTDLLEWGSRVATNNARPPHDVVVL